MFILPEEVTSSETFMDGHCTVSGDLSKAMTLENIMEEARAAEDESLEKKKWGGKMFRQIILCLQRFRSEKTGA